MSAALLNGLPGAQKVMVKNIIAEKEELQTDHEKLKEEVAKLKKDLATKSAADSSAQAAPAPVQGLRIVQDDNQVASHHMQILEMNETIDDLHKELADAREENRKIRSVLEQSSSSTAANGTIDGTMSQTMGATMKLALRPPPAAEDFASLEQENHEIRLKLNEYLEKVVELQKRLKEGAKEEKKKTALVEEKLTIEQQTNSDQRKELSRLTLELQQERQRSQEHAKEQDALIGKYELKIRALRDKAQKESDERREEATITARENGKLHSSVNAELTRVTEELQSVLIKHSKLMSRFVEHIQKPLEGVRQHSKMLLEQAKRQGRGFDAAERPAKFEPNSNDDEISLRWIAQIVAWSSKVFEDYAGFQQQRNQGYI